MSSREVEFDIGMEYHHHQPRSVYRDDLDNVCGWLVLHFWCGYAAGCANASSGGVLWKIPWLIPVPR